MGTSAAAGRDVDVTIRGRNDATPAFRAAAADVGAFEQGVKRVLNPLTLLKGILAGLGIASLGAIFRRATTAAIDHEQSLGRNVAQLDRLSSAWDYVLVTLGRAILGLGETESLVGRATNALAGMGEWIDSHRGSFSDFADFLGRIARGLDMIATGRGIGIIERIDARLDPGFAAFQTEGVRPIGTDGPAYRGGAVPLPSPFEQFIIEQQAARQRAEADRERRRAEADAAREAQRLRERQERELYESTLAAQSNLYRPGRFGTRLDGPVVPPMEPVSAETIKSIETATEGLSRMELAAGAVRDTVYEMSDSVIGSFASAWTDATMAIVTGSERAGAAIGKAIRRGVGMGLVASGQSWILEAGAIAVKGLYNPVDWWRAGRLALYGTTAIALGGVMAGGGAGGGSGGLSVGSMQSQASDVTDGRGDGTIIVQGGLLDMNDPRQAEALADAINDLNARRIVIKGSSR